MPAIGPTFSDELRAAGLAGLQFSWGEDGALEFDGSMTPEERQAVQAVYDTHVAKPVLTFASREVRNTDEVDNPTRARIRERYSLEKELQALWEAIQAAGITSVVLGDIAALVQEGADFKAAHWP
ncbi:MAG: hypothetical protein HY724_05690 [Candidatus Rokubacteria bacterium]|nr:hypothetical protein [Candidatus Rokubacteria bacterium]